jgi:dTDP-4-dehydrorhamnose reductase
MLGQLHDNQDERWGLYHVCPTGYTSWHSYAAFAIAYARQIGWPVCLLNEAISGIASADYPVKAPRPRNSRLSTAKLRDAFGLALPHWHTGVRDVVAQLERPA